MKDIERYRRRTGRSSRRVLVPLLSNWLAGLGAMAIIAVFSMVLGWIPTPFVEDSTSPMRTLEDDLSTLKERGGWNSASWNQREALRTSMIRALEGASSVEKGDIVVQLRDLGAIGLGSDRPMSMAGIDLSGADLEGADLDDVTLRGADLRQSNLSYTSLCRSDLQYIKGTDADFRHAIAVGVDLSRARLNRVDFSHADLSGSTIREAQLYEAVFEGTVLYNVDLDSAGDATGFDGAIHNRSTLRDRCRRSG